MYRFDKRSADDGKFWRCLKDGCQGRIKTDSTDVFIEYRNSAHSHAAVPEEATVRQIITTMKNRAETETGSVAQVYREETAALVNQPTMHSRCNAYVSRGDHCFVPLMHSSI